MATHIIPPDYGHDEELKSEARVSSYSALELDMIPEGGMESTEVGLNANGDEKRQFAAFHPITRLFLRWGIETYGISPTTPGQRVDQRLYQMFWIWFSANFNILAFITGSAGPAFFGLGLWEAIVILLIVDILTCAIPAYFAVFGPKLGTRAMVQCRFSWGLYGSIIPSMFNILTCQGFLILNCIIGAQALSAAISHKLDDTLGIVIISVISFVVSFYGYKCLHLFASVAWITSLISFPIIVGLAAKHLDPSTFPPVKPPTAAEVISFASFVASTVIGWSTFTPDYGVYHDSKTSTLKIFTYAYSGFLIPSIAWHILGAAISSATPGVPAWEKAFGRGNMGGLLAAVLAPAGGFGKFLLVVLAISTSTACAPTMYTFGTSFMAIAPCFERVPRYVYPIVCEAILLPVAIIGVKNFYGTLVNIMSVIGYWSTAFAVIVLTEHFLFRRSSFTEYKTSHWDRGDLLPLGIAAVLAFGGAFGIIVPTMSQRVYSGPIARMGVGDFGIFSGAAVAFVLYALLRTVERKVWPGR